MGATVTTLPVVPSRSAARQALAVAIQELSDTRRELKEVKAARDNLFGHKLEARERVEAAKEELVRVQGEATKVFIAALSRDTLPAPRSTVEARVAIQDAEDAVAALEGLEPELESREGELYRSLYYKESAVRTKALAVMKEDPSVRRLAEEFAALHRAYLATRQAFEWLRLNHVTPDDVRAYITSQEETALHGEGPWKAAFEALQGDADTPLPTL